MSSPFSTRALHLDLKGVAPTMARMPSQLKLIARAGYNALLIEWEGMFPWTVDPRFRVPYAYSPADIAKIVSLAKELNLQIIPLVQCFGHMETPLSVEEYAPLRHVPNRANVLNPLAAGARELIERMIDDVLSLCGPLTYFHLGGDEAFSFGKTESDKAFIEKHGKPALYLHHVEPLLDKLNAAGVRPILWHDMMSSWEVADLKRIVDKTDLMVWGYGPDPANSTGHYRTEVIEKFRTAGMRMWAGCAYKGAEGPIADLPDFPTRCKNATAWVEIGKRFGFHGAAATAWSRYMTHRVQCQPIDGALDALVATGLILRDGGLPADIRERALAVLQELGERENFEKLHAALTESQSERENAWKMMRQTREHLALGERDPFRRKSAVATECLKDAVWHLDNSRKAAERAKPLLQGKISDAELEEYFYERFEPLQRQVPELIAGVKQQEPETWAAATKHLAKVDAIVL